MFFQVGDRVAKEILAILESAQARVATVAQETSPSTSVVVMVCDNFYIYTNNTHFATDWALPKRASFRSEFLRCVSLSTRDCATVYILPANIA